jgi:hypothetical protein
MQGYAFARNGIQEMSRAVISIRNGDCNQVKASKMYNVPRQALQRYLKKYKFTVPKLGRKPEMGIDAENCLEKYFILCQKCGFGLTRHELRTLAFSFMESLGFVHRFNRTPQDYRPQGRELVHKQTLGIIRSKVGPFFEILERKMIELVLRNKPDNI